MVSNQCGSIKTSWHQPLSWQSEHYNRRIWDKITTVKTHVYLRQVTCFFSMRNVSSSDYPFGQSCAGIEALSFAQSLCSREELQLTDRVDPGKIGWRVISLFLRAMD
jgi:hypothetical protein